MTTCALCMPFSLRGLIFATATFLIAQSSSGVCAEEVIEIATRPGQSVRALIDKPAKPIGSVILLVGGHGNLDLSAHGQIGWGAKNQVVRTRAAYTKMGFVALVPDIAPDFKQGTGTKPSYRWSGDHAVDIGAMVRHLRSIAAPVYIVGTSRAAMSVANAAVRLKGSERPDAIVITSGMIAAIDAKSPSAESKVGRLERITQPVLLVFHKDDGCRHTPASSASRAKALFKGAKRVDLKILTGGNAGSGDPCQAQSHHGFLGQDDEVVELISSWLKDGAAK